MRSSIDGGRLVGPLAALLTPALLAFSILYHFAQRVPIIDDYETVVQFSLNYLQLPDTQSRLLYLLSSQHNEYKFVFEHLVVAADLALSGHLHFAALLLAGNFFFVMIFGLLWHMAAGLVKDLRQRVLLLVPVSLLFFGINYAESTNFPSASLDYLPAIFFSFAAIQVLTRRRLTPAWFCLACICALLAYASAINAFLLWPIGLVLLLPGRRWGLAVAWCGALAVGLVPYLYHYTWIVHPGAKGFLTMPLFLLAFLGAGGPVHQVAIGVGVVLVAIFAWSLRQGVLREQPAVFWCGVWVMLSGAMTAYGRSNLGVALAGGLRYRMFSDLLIIFCYFILARAVLTRTLPPARRTLLYRCAVGAALVCFVRADRLGWQFLAQRQADVRAGTAHFRAAPQTASPMFFANADDERSSRETEVLAREIALRAVAAGLYPVP